MNLFFNFKLSRKRMEAKPVSPSAYTHIRNTYTGRYCPANFPDIGRNKDAFFLMSSFWSNLFYTQLANAHSEACQISKMEIFIKIVKSNQPLAIFLKNLHLRCTTGF